MSHYIIIMICLCLDKNEWSILQEIEKMMKKTQEAGSCFTGIFNT